MVQEPNKLYLRHILDAIKNIEEYIQGQDFEQFTADIVEAKKTRAAVVKEFENIGEASKNLTKAMKESVESVEWQQIIDMRNNLIHEYFGIDYEIVWDTVKEDLPRLQEVVQKLLPE